jgi:hypothetical protein
MTPEQLDKLSSRHGVFLSIAYRLEHPHNDLERWRKDWGQINELVDEINQLVGPASAEN